MAGAELQSTILSVFCVRKTLVSYVSQSVNPDPYRQRRAHLNTYLLRHTHAEQNLKSVVQKGIESGATGLESRLQESTTKSSCS